MARDTSQPMTTMSAIQVQAYLDAMVQEMGLQGAIDYLNAQRGIIPSNPDNPNSPSTIPTTPIPNPVPPSTSPGSENTANTTVAAFPVPPPIIPFPSQGSPFSIPNYNPPKDPTSPDSTPSPNQQPLPPQGVPNPKTSSDTYSYPPTAFQEPHPGVVIPDTPALNPGINPGSLGIAGIAGVAAGILGQGNPVLNNSNPNQIGNVPYSNLDPINQLPTDKAPYAPLAPQPGSDPAAPEPYTPSNDPVPYPGPQPDAPGPGTDPSVPFVLPSPSTAPSDAFGDPALGDLGPIRWNPNIPVIDPKEVPIQPPWRPYDPNNPFDPVNPNSPFHDPNDPDVAPEPGEPTDALGAPSQDPFISGTDPVPYLGDVVPFQPPPANDNTAQYPGTPPPTVQGIDTSTFVTDPNYRPPPPDWTLEDQVNPIPPVDLPFGSENLIDAPQLDPAFQGPPGTVWDPVEQEYVPYTPDAPFPNPIDMMPPDIVGPPADVDVPGRTKIAMNDPIDYTAIYPSGPGSGGGQANMTTPNGQWFIFVGLLDESTQYPSPLYPVTMSNFAVEAGPGGILIGSDFCSGVGYSGTNPTLPSAFVGQAAAFGALFAVKSVGAPGVICQITTNAVHSPNQGGNFEGYIIPFQLGPGTTYKSTSYLFNSKTWVTADAVNGGSGSVVTSQYTWPWTNAIPAVTIYDSPGNLFSNSITAPDPNGAEVPGIFEMASSLTITVNSIDPSGNSIIFSATSDGTDQQSWGPYNTSIPDV